MLLSDKVAIVTGGSRGIGEAVVRMFVKEGAKVAFTYLNSDDKAKEIVERLGGDGKEVMAFKKDVKDLSEMKETVAAVREAFGGIDIVVNNAGILRDRALMMMDREDWDDVISTNLNGTFNLVRAVIVTFLKQRSGNIINMASVAGITGTARQVNYSASKAGVIGLTKALAKEVGPYNVRVNAIAPGYTETDMLKGLKDDHIDRIKKAIPLGRFGDSREVAELALFLASDRSAYVTGQVIAIDGGLVV